MKIHNSNERFDAVIDALNGNFIKFNTLIDKEAKIMTKEIMENTRIGDTTPSSEEVRESMNELTKSESKQRAELDFSELNESVRKIKESLHKIEVQVLEGGKLPCKAHASDAGFDLFATEDVIVYPGQIVKHPLNVKMKLPVGSWARIETKSGLGSRGMLVYAGVVDRDYRGVPHVICTSLGNGAIEIKKGQKIAQMTMNPHSEEFYAVEVDEISEDTSRGSGGFGSTGE